MNGLTLKAKIMTDEEIIKMANQAKLPHDYVGGGLMWLDKLEIFAKLVAEKATAELRSDVKINQKNLLQKLTRGQE